MTVDALEMGYFPSLDFTGYSRLYNYGDFNSRMIDSIYTSSPYSYNPGIYRGYVGNTNIEYGNTDYITAIKERRSMELELNSGDEGIQRALSVLNEKIVQSEQEQIQNAFDGVKSALRSKYPSASEEAITNRAHTLYQRTYGATITEDLRTNGSGSFWQGVKQTLTLGLADKTTAEENIAKLNNQEVGRSEKAKKVAGNVVGGAALGAAIGSIIPGVGTVVGAVAGAVVGTVLGGIFTFASKK